MKKRIISVLLIAVTALSLTGCGKYTCALCGQEKSGKSYKYEGETLCKDCYNGIKALESLFGDF